MEQVEQFIICSPHDGISWKMFHDMIGNAEDLNKSLGIPYRIVSIVSGTVDINLCIYCVMESLNE